jgi:hypothetical protein
MCDWAVGRAVAGRRSVGGECDASDVRPALKAGLLPVWRDRETVQIGIDPRRAVALTGMGDAALVIGLLDGSRDRGQVIAAAQEQGIAEAVTDRIITLLAAGGALDDFPAAAMRALSQEQRRRLGAELAAAALASGHSDAGATALARRDAARVQVYGPGRVAVGIADILATSGVGRVAICDNVRPAQSTASARPGRSPQRRAPGGIRASQPGTRPGSGDSPRQGSARRASGASQPGTRPGSGDSPRQGSARGASGASQPGTRPGSGDSPAPDSARRASGARQPETEAASGGRAARVSGRGAGGMGGAGGGRQLGELPDLAILVGYRDPELPAALVRAGVAHLAVTAEEAIGVVGPLVRPGRTACLRCLDLIRSGLDSAWPLILAQLAGRTTSPPACDAALAAAVSGQAAGQALAFLDRQPGIAPTENGTLELVPPGWQWRRRTWPPHPSCGCRASAAG